MQRKPVREFSWIEGLALFLCCIAIQLMSEVLAQWGIFFYSPGAQAGRTIYVPIGLAGTIFIIGILFDALSDPIIGLWSDKTRTRPGLLRVLPISGRRRPFIFWGSIGMLFTSILFWYPPVHGESFLNFIYATVIVCIHGGIFFTMCAVPFNALAPEIARSHEARVKIGTWIAAGMIVGLAFASIAPGILVDALDPARRVPASSAAVETTAAADAAEAAPGAAAEAEQTSYSPVGYQRTGMIFGVISLVFFQFAVWTVRERYRSEEKPPRTASLGVMKQALSNTVFLRFLAIFLFFNIGFLGVQRVLPYWVQVGLESEENMVSLLMAPFILTALTALTFTGSLAKRIPVKWLLFAALAIIGTGLPFMYVIAVAEASVTAKLVMGAILFGYCGIGQGMLYLLMTPLIGEIIDLDEKSSGERREAVYGSLHGLAWKGSQALSVVLASQCMRVWGNSPDRPLGIYIVGPIAGLFALLGLAVCWTYPVLHVTREIPPEPAQDPQ